MRRLAASPGYARFRLVVGAIATMLGAVIVVRTALAVGANAHAVPAYVFGAALIALGLLRFADYRRAMLAAGSGAAPGDRT